MRICRPGRCAPRPVPTGTITGYLADLDSLLPAAPVREVGCSRQRDGRLHTEPWTPHITLAYSNMAGPAAPVIAALGRQLPQREITINSVSLIAQAPEQLWTWHPVAQVSFGTELPWTRLSSFRPVLPRLAPACSPAMADVRGVLPGGCVF